MRAVDFTQILVENTTTLNQIYKNEFPDRDELFWEYATLSDFTQPLTVEKMAPYKLEIILKSEYRVEHIDELFDLMSREQRQVVKQYMKQNLSHEAIVLADGRIIDGNHRALAAVLSKQTINAVSLDELED